MSVRKRRFQLQNRFSFLTSPLVHRRAYSHQLFSCANFRSIASKILLRQCTYLREDVLTASFVFSAIMHAASFIFKTHNFFPTLLVSNSILTTYGQTMTANSLGPYNIDGQTLTRQLFWDFDNARSRRK